MVLRCVPVGPGPQIAGAARRSRNFRRSLGLLASLDHIDCGHIALDREGLPPLSPATGEGRAEPMVSVTITDITTLIIAITGLITAMSGTISVISRIRQRRRHGHDRRRVSRTISRMGALLLADYLRILRGGCPRLRTNGRPVAGARGLELTGARPGCSSQSHRSRRCDGRPTGRSSRCR